MEAVRAGELIVEHDGVTVTVLGGDDGIDEASALLDEAEEAAGAPLVDESERLRLRALLEDAPAVDVPHWHPLLARHGDRPTGYAGVLLAGGEVTGDLAVLRTTGQDGATTALFGGVRHLAQGHDVGRATIWIRHARDRDVVCADAAGFREDRRLLVLGRALDDLTSPAPPDGLRIRPFRSGDDDRTIVDVLAGAFAGTPDAGWDLGRLEERRSYDWFDPDDLLVAESDGEVLAVHWTKRRGGGVGEVYVLAVSPEAHGRGLGRTMLRAGLHHLAEVGCDDVVLWVDAANEPAVRLYLTEGFAERWVDVAFSADLH